MIIKTITCHKVYNHGASLQEYALLKYLNDLGLDAETIDYTPNYLSDHFNLLAVSNPRFGKNIFIKILYLVAKLPQRLPLLKRKKAFDVFEEKFIPSTSYNYKTNEELKRKLPDAEVYICGSDQIWNSFFQNGKDPAFYLDFVPDDKLKISYAASFAIDKIENDLKPFVKEKLERLNKVSVRESSGLTILSELGIQNGIQVLDPVFLLDGNFWEDTFITTIVENYIFVYDCDSNVKIKEIAKATAKKFDLKIFTVNQNIKYADKNFFKKGPEAFLSLIKSSKFIISNSFHAVAFSLIFNKIFFVVDRTENINTRMRDMMDMVDLTDLHLGVNEFKSFEDVSIDFKKVNKIISTKIIESKLFLRESIKI
jgi:hypothetical protein